MTTHRRPSRGLTDLKTLTGRSDNRIPAHKAYLRASFLELERARRRMEMRAAEDRSAHIQERFREIDAEIADIMSNMRGTSPRARPVEAPHKSPVGFTRTKRSFQISY
ncbi:hypothetical protein [Methylocystis bryophila]|uniref:Uncharacterized protein n=1 Tax=Methylocystis bryophila TaxID=655015 RepID=A0A1W6MXZ2_9HYPH|nr:hypothetical protein [Methylocystis bryophila]ARN82433.1 hypothetical protein B1812_16600 [Methylocystis bryophila]BDV38616.1 hypothetical protein DSM21852_18690 [Methylocystis bryophila]